MGGPLVLYLDQALANACQFFAVVPSPAKSATLSNGSERRENKVGVTCPRPLGRGFGGIYILAACNRGVIRRMDHDLLSRIKEVTRKWKELARRSGALSA